MSQTTKRFTVILGIFLSVAMAGSLVLPLFSGQMAQSGAYAETPQATPLPEPTFPPPPDTSAIDFEATYLHESGLFTLGAPTGWVASSSETSADELSAKLNNAAASSVIHARIIRNAAGIVDAEGLSAYFDEAWQQSAWREYWGWDETKRDTGAGDRLVIDFNLRRSRSYFIARQESWLQDGDIYSVSVVTAENAPRELKFLLEGVGGSLSRVAGYEASAFDWHAYFDNLDKHMIRYPAGWSVADAAPGLPAAIVGDGATLALETRDAALDGENAAAEFVESWRGSPESLSVEALQREGADGYRVSYRQVNADGAPESGLAIMLQGADDRWHVAYLRLAETDADLLAVDPADYPQLAALDSFRLMPTLNVTA